MIEMESLQVEGKWEGAIILGPEYGENEGKETFFELELIQEVELIRGILWDIRGFACNPDPADLVGSLSNPAIHFIKQYRSILSISKNEELIYDRSRKGPRIAYSGIFDKNGEFVSGTWKMEIIYDHNRRMMNIPSTGKWYMKKV